MPFAPELPMPQRAFNAYWDALVRLTDFNGRATRFEFWSFFVLNLLISSALGFFDGRMGLAFPFPIAPFSDLGLLSGFYCAAVMLPYVALSLRRLRDAGRSGWWLLSGLVPVVGFVTLLYFYTRPSVAPKTLSDYR